MSAFSKLGVPEVATALAIGALLGLVLWLAWRKPTLVLQLALAALALRPQLLWGGPALGFEWGPSQSLVVFGLALNALRYGVRRTPNWPILALVLVLALNLAFGHLHPKLTPGFMLESLAILALPFVFTQVVLAPGSRLAYATVIMLTPLLSAVLAVLLDAAGIRPVSLLGWSEVARFEGAAGNAAVFAALGFSGLVVAVHESTRPGRWYAAPLAVLNFALVALSLTRMAVLASLVFVAAYTLLSADLRARWRTHRIPALLLLAVAAAVLILTWSSLEERMFAGPGDQVNMSGRQEIWPFYYEEFLLSPVVGRGLGAGFVAAHDWFAWALPTPHDEYLHYLVIGGVVGFVLIVGGIGLWYRHLLQTAAAHDRPYLLALIPAVAVYAVTDNLSFYTTVLPLYAYLSVLLTRPSPVPTLFALRPAGPAASPPATPDPLVDDRLRAALARMRATSDAVERLTSRRSR